MLILSNSTRLASESSMQVSASFQRHIELLEGFRAKAYRDAGGLLTIGYGHLVKPSEGHLKTATLSREQALELLRKDIRWAEETVARYVTVPLKQEQYDALVSFVFNIGPTQFRRSTLLRRLNAGQCCAVPDELRRWTRAGGRVVQGLVNRRNAEVALYTGAGVA